MSEAGPFELLEGHPYTRLTTFRRSGKAVPTTVWFALVEDKAYVFNERELGQGQTHPQQPPRNPDPQQLQGKARSTG